MWVVGAANGVEVVLFHQPNVALDSLQRLGVAMFRVVFVLVSICHQKRFLIARRFTETYEQKIKYVGAKNMAQMLI